MQDWIKRLFAQFGDDGPDAEAGTVPGSEPAQAAADVVNVQQLVEMAISTSPDEIGCDEFFEQMDRFVELSLDGYDVAALMPLMQDHLERCRDCREEYEALQRALHALA